MTFRTADHVISTNDSYKAVALKRGGLRDEQVTVVRSGPDTAVMRPVYPDADVRHGADYLLVYLGIMGPQDGVGIVLDVMDELVNRRGHQDIRAALLGFGDCLDDLRRRCTELGLDDVVEFTGRAHAAQIATYLSAADVGLGPIPKTPLNDVSTMNKTMEYMAFALPSVAFDLSETRVSGRDAVLYVDEGDISGFATAVERLLSDEDLRLEMALGARARVQAELDWRAQRIAYLDAMDAVTGHDPGRQKSREEVAGSLRGGVGPGGQDYVDLSDADELRRFLLQRNRQGAVDAGA